MRISYKEDDGRWLMEKETLAELGFGDTDDLERVSCDMLENLCGTRYSADDQVAQSLARSYIAAIASSAVTDEAWPYGQPPLEEFCDDLLTLLAEEGVTQERLGPAFASTIADNAYRQAVADVDWAYEHLHANIREDISFGDFCPDVGLSQDQDDHVARSL